MSLQQGRRSGFWQERKTIESFLLWATWSNRKFTNHTIRAEKDVEKLGPISLLYKWEKEQH